MLRKKELIELLNNKKFTVWYNVYYSTVQYSIVQSIHQLNKLEPTTIPKDSIMLI